MDIKGQWTENTEKTERYEIQADRQRHIDREIAGQS
jgi:hypothetical protein